MTSKYTAVIFDLWGTLVEDFSLGDRKQEHDQLMTQMADALSIPHQEFHRWWTETWPMRAIVVLPTIESNIEYICHTLNWHVPASQVEQAARLRYDYVRRAFVLRQDAVETLTELKGAGYRIELISDCTPEVPSLWQASPLAPFVDAPIFSCVVGIKKPDPRIYQRACERLGVRPQECLYVGDGGSRELTGAAQVGMHPVLIRLPYLDSYQEDAKDWQGPTISTLKKVLALVE